MPAISSGFARDPLAGSRVLWYILCQELLPVDGMTVANRLHNPFKGGGFPVYFAAAVMARLANEGLKLGLVLAAATTPAGLKLGGLLVAAFLIPSVLSAPFVGRLADSSRHPTRLYSAAFAFNGLIIALTGLLLHTAPAPIILAMAALGGAVGPLLMGGLSSLVGSIVARDQLHRAYAMDVVTYNVSAILAPAIVAAVASLINPLTAVMLLAALMLAASLVVLRINLRSRDQIGQLPTSSPVDGLRALGTIVPLRSTATATSLASGGLGVLPIAATLLAANTYSVNAGVLLSTMAVGSLVGSLAYASRPFGTERPHRMVPWITLIVAIPLALLIFTRSTPFALMLFALAGALGGPQGTAQFSTRDMFSPPAVRTQVFTLSTSFKTTCSALGAAVAGFMAGASPQTLLLIAVLCNVIGGGVAELDLMRNWSRDRDPVESTDVVAEV